MMSVISNPAFTQAEKRYLDFILQHEFDGKDQVISQLNSMKAAQITREITPYTWIMEFRPNGVNPGQGPMRPYISLQVRHENVAAPTVFCLYERNGVVFELEIFNADSSALQLDAIPDGAVFVD